MILSMGFEPVDEFLPERGMVWPLDSTGCQFAEEATTGRDS
jgi:hypothetical protein